MRELLRRRESVLVAMFAIVVAAVYVASPVIQSGDGRLVVYESESILHDGNLDLHEYGTAVHGFPCYREDGRILSRYPYGTALMTVPLLTVAKGGGAIVGENPTESLREKAPREFEKGLASVIAALAATALVLLAREAIGRNGPALALGAAFAFGTALWSTVSRGLWQHGPMMLLVTLGLLCLLRGRERDDWRWPAAAGLSLGMAYVVRPTAAVTIALAAVVLLFGNRRAFAVYAAAVLCVVGPSTAYNLHVYGQLGIPFYFMGDGFLGHGVRDSFWTGLGGTTVSPARGLLIFSPLVALAGVGVWMRRRELNGVDVIAIGSLGAIWLVTANTEDWAGGWSFGPRLMADTLPFLAYLIAPVFGAVVAPARSWSRATRAMAAVLVIAVAWSVAVNARGALSWSTQTWNVRPEPAGVQKTPHRFWDWSDPQFLRAEGATMKDIYPWETTPVVPPEQTCLD